MANCTKCRKTEALPNKKRCAACASAGAAVVQRWRERHPEVNAARRTAHYAANKERLKQYGRDHYAAKPELYRKQALMRNFGLTPEQYAEMLAAQDGGCAVCKTKTPGGKGAFHVDHRHVEGYASMPPEEKRLHVRGLLCHACNTRWGEGPPNLLRSAADYLERHEQSIKQC